MEKIGKVFVDVNNARNDEMVKVLEQIVTEGIDPFSLDHMGKHHKKPILKIGKHWFVTENQWMYPNSKHQFVFVTIKYAESFTDLDPEVFVELLSLATEFCEEYSIKGGALCMRFGDTSLTGATVKHLHAQLIESDTEKGTVVFPIGKSKK